MSKNDDILVSVVIPVYNAEKYILDALKSTKKQTFRHWECIIVNDGSTDKSLELINEFIKSDSRFRCITTENSGCANIPRSIAIKNAKGKYISYLDADDFFVDSGCLDKMYNRAIETEAEIVLLQLELYDINNKHLQSIPSHDFDLAQILTGKEACFKTLLNWEIGCNGIIRKDLFNDIEFGNLMNSDEFLSRQLLLKAKKVAFADTEYHYRINSESITQKNTAKFFQRALIDKELEDFVIANYSDQSELVLSFKKKRFVDYFYLHKELVLNKKLYSDKDYIEARRLLKNVFSSFAYDNEIRKMLPKRFSIIRFQCYPLVWIMWSYYIKRKYGKN